VAVPRFVPRGAARASLHVDPAPYISAESSSAAACPRPGKLRSYAASSFIVITLGLQTLAVFGKLPQQLWPFLNYPMYRTARGAGDEILAYAVYGRSTSGEEYLLSAEDLGISVFKFQRGLVRAIRDGRAERAAVYASIYAERRGRPLESLRVVARPVVWNDGRAEPKPERTVATMTLPEAGKGQ